VKDTIEVVLFTLILPMSEASDGNHVFYHFVSGLLRRRHFLVYIAQNHPLLALQSIRHQPIRQEAGPRQQTILSEK
jgi:hypothetical protein